MKKKSGAAYLIKFLVIDGFFDEGRTTRKTLVKINESTDKSFGSSAISNSLQNLKWLTQYTKAGEFNYMINETGIKQVEDFNKYAL